LDPGIFWKQLTVVGFLRLFNFECQSSPLLRQASIAQVMSLFDLHMQDQRMNFPDVITSDIGLTFADTDPWSSDSELGDIIGSDSEDRDAWEDCQIF